MGLIPAHAGKTPSPRQRRARLGAHPRSRGENTPDKDGDEQIPGSSPLTRGKQQAPRDVVRAIRLIPAHAGKTSETAFLTGATTAHPRSRGENARVEEEVEILHGSSPLTRGKRTLDGLKEGYLGLIPAHAGKTSHVTAPSPETQAHPRSRGENGHRPMTGATHPGSSPLTRGKRSQNLFVQAARRLIPAHAGKTASCIGLPAPSWAHPRSRGENARDDYPHCTPPGSSPLTRGKPGRDRVDRIGLRLIPAHAGKTVRCGPPAGRQRAHPRSRGENCRASWSTSSRRGSSPLTRGKHF